MTFLWWALAAGVRISEGREHPRRDQAERKTVKVTPTAFGSEMGAQIRHKLGTPRCNL